MLVLGSVNCLNGFLRCWLCCLAICGTYPKGVDIDTKIALGVCAQGAYAKCQIGVHHQNQIGFQTAQSCLRVHRLVLRV